MHYNVLDGVLSECYDINLDVISCNNSSMLQVIIVAACQVKTSLQLLQREYLNCIDPCNCIPIQY